MSTFGNILSTARMAIAAHQTAIQVTSNNVANAETPGYTRQRAQLVQNTPQALPYGNIGTGVLVHDVVQIRDTLLDASFRRESSQAAGFGLRSDLLGQLEGIFNEPTEGAFASTLDAFWNAWSDLANAPTDRTARDVVRQRGSQVAFALNGYAARLDELTADTAARVGRSVDQLNALSRQVAELNVQIVSMEVGGHMASDLRDQRNVALDAMSKLAAVQIAEGKDGSVSVAFAGQSLVDGDTAKQLGYGGSPPGVRLSFAGSTQPLPELGGELGAMLELLNADIPATRARLDELAAGIVSSVNALHRTGWSPAQEPVPPGPPAPVTPPGWSGSGIDFFAPGSASEPVTAATIALSSEVLANRDYIAASAVYGGTGDNTIARGLSRLRDTETSVGGASVVLGTHFRDTVTGIAMKASDAESSATAFGTLASQADLRRQSVGGVSTDEELIQLMRHQQAYVAATRLVSTVDEMAQALLSMV